MAAKNRLHLTVFILAAIGIIPAMASLEMEYDYKEMQENVYTWGANCELSCSNCSDNCDQEFGVCKHCQPGFKYPFTACTQECDMYEYGVNCEGNCLRKCGTDCLERKNGTCPTSVLYYSCFLFMVLVMIAALRIIYERNKREGINGNQKDH